MLSTSVRGITNNAMEGITFADPQIAATVIDVDAIEPRCASATNTDAITSNRRGGRGRGATGT